MLKKLEAYGRKLLSRAVLSHFGSEEVYRRIPENVKLKRILIMRWDAIGDMVVCLPLFRKIRDLFPEAEVGIVVSRRNNSLLKYEDDFHTILYDSNPSIYLKSIIEARRFRPDAVVDTRMHYDSTTSFIYGVISRAKWRLSASNRDNRLPFSVRVPMPPGRHHYADLTRILLEGLGKNIDESELDREIRLSSEEIEFANSFWRENCFGFRKRVIGINISAGNPLRIWGERNTAELCSILISSGFIPLLFSTPDDRKKALRISSEIPGVLVIPECQTILHAASLLKNLKMLITLDTALVHIAAAHDVPVLGLFPQRESHMPLWYPWKIDNELVRTPSERVEDITVHDVVKAFRKLIDKIELIEG